MNNLASRQLARLVSGPRWGWCLTLLLVLAAPGGLAAQNRDQAALLQGVGDVPLPLQPDALCTVVSVSERPEVVLTAQTDPDPAFPPFHLPLLTSSRLGRGKVLVFSTAAYFRRPLVQEPAVQRLLANCLRWGTGGTHPPRVQVWGGDATLRAWLTGPAHARLVGAPPVPDSSADVLVLNEEVADTTVMRRIGQFVRRGGTLLYGSPLPDLPQGARARAENRFNQLLTQAGLWQGIYLQASYGQRRFAHAGPGPGYVSLRIILGSFGTTSYAQAVRSPGGYLLAYTLDRAVALSPPGSPLLAKLKQLAHYHPDSLIVPTAARPVRQGPDGRYLAYLLQYRLQEQALLARPDPTYVAPAAASFPGAVPATAARTTTELRVPVRVGPNGVAQEPGPGYRQPHGTGLYVPAGERVSIYLAGSDSARHLQAQIGVHSDELTHLPQLTREAFDLTRRFELSAGRTEVYSPYGGLLLLNAPDTTTLKELRVEVQGAVQAPRFERGKTSLAAWQQTIRHYPVPWAELVSDNVSLTVPAARIRTLDDPEKVLAFWDAVLAADARLAALPGPRRHAERIIVDQQVSLGYMFTVPDKIVVPDDQSCRQLLNADFMRKTGNWGAFHELGHRHQFAGIDFAGLGEVSPNLYTLYVFDKLLDKGLYGHHPNIQSRAAVAEKVTDYLAGAPSFEQWQGDPFLALSMYVQLLDGFGWQPLEQVYRQYRQLPRSQYPATDAAGRDYWFRAICAATRRNLGPFFAQWRVPVGETALRAVVRYPTWLPAEMPRPPLAPLESGAGAAGFPTLNASH